MWNLPTTAAPTALAAVFALAGCSFEDRPPDPCEPRVPAPVDPDGSLRHYVVNQILLATTAAEANQFGLNIDGDPQGRPDNALGQIITTVNGQLGGIDLREETQLLVDAGELLHLLSIQKLSLSDATGVGVTVRHALDTDGDPTDNFSGDELFAINRTRGDGTIAGLIEDGVLRAELGTAPVAVTLPGLGEPVIIQLAMAQIEATVTPTGIEGRIGGGVSEAETADHIIPLFHEGLSRKIARDCDPDGCYSGSFGELLLRIFDENEDGVMTLDEFRDAPLVSSLLAPDVDLLDYPGRHIAPRCDGVKDHLSIGLAFTAVPARVVGE